MKFNITPNSVDYAEIEEKLISKFPDYEYNMRGKQYLVCKKTGTIGANVVIRKNRIMVAGNFPSMGGQMLFILSVVLLGFLIPLIVYFAAFHSKMKAMEKEIGGYLEQEYGVKA